MQLSWVATASEHPHALPAVISVAAISVVIALIQLLRYHQRLPRVSCSFVEVLRNYQPGRILDLHHAYAVAAKDRCWTIKVPGDPRIFGTVDPRLVEHVLKDPRVWEKGAQWRTAFQDALGDGIFNADGKSWASQRKVASHEFSIRSLKTYMSAVFRANGAIVHRLCDAAVGDGETDVQDLFARYTLDRLRR
mmetsp:Transcript_18679/g.59498  ORF Transcript_18679/g.59498 Transcript_18679/m.59498 type:complete len:192 (-) Transcript_18679:1013-1588(-)